MVGLRMVFLRVVPGLRTNGRRAARQAAAGIFSPSVDAWPIAVIQEGMTHKGLPIHAFETGAHWWQWLATNGAASRGLWLKFYKKGSGQKTVGKSEAIEAALAHGWIDGQLDRFDDAAWLVRFTPRKSTSKWSELNRKTAERLIEEGRMAAAGLAEVERARADGRWDAAYAPQGHAGVPEDLAAALDASPQAKAFFETLTGANRYAIIYRTHNARKPETRKARIEKFVAMLERGEVIHPKKG
jgi:uncharacterized protein YdeI (YjbR/CyaY-like superfamily)